MKGNIPPHRYRRRRTDTRYLWGNKMLTDYKLGVLHLRDKVELLNLLLLFTH